MAGFTQRQDKTIAEQAPPPAARGQLSRQLWGLDWERLLSQIPPHHRVAVAWSSYQEMAPFLAERYASIFDQDSELPFSVSSPDTAARVRFFQSVCDFFEFRDAQGTCGVFIGAPCDWSSYHIRSIAMLPEYEGNSPVRGFFIRFCGWLKAAGVERLVMETSPANIGMVHYATRFRFNATGTLLTERWGALVQFTKFLSEPHEDIFLKQFCLGVKYQRRDRGPSEFP